MKLKMKMPLVVAGALAFLAACGPNSEGGSQDTHNSGGEGATDITRVPNMDSSVLTNDSSGVHGDTTNLQKGMR